MTNDCRLYESILSDARVADASACVAVAEARVVAVETALGGHDVASAEALVETALATAARARTAYETAHDALTAARAAVEAEERELHSAAVRSAAEAVRTALTAGSARAHSVAALVPVRRSVLNEAIAMLVGTREVVRANDGTLCLTHSATTAA